MSKQVNPNTPGRTTSFSAAVAALAVGEESGKLKRLNTDGPLSDVLAAMPAQREALHNTVSTIASRARSKTGGSYRVEVSDFMTTSKNWFLVAVVTRTA
jgi:hypothetical protein